MIYSCIECHSCWCSKEKYKSLDIDKLDLDSMTEISHGLCPSCFQKHKEFRVHNHQKKNGYDECYNRNDGCDNNFCMFRPTCGSQALNNWRDQIVLLGVQTKA